jgi:DNA-binding protein YbaB
MYDDLYALVNELERNLHQQEAAAAASASAALERPIPGGLGTVTVSGTGALLNVTIDPHGLRSTNGRALGAQIAQTIRGAEAHAQAVREQRIAEAAHNVP